MKRWGRKLGMSVETHLAGYGDIPWAPEKFEQNEVYPQSFRYMQMSISVKLSHVMRLVP